MAGWEMGADDVAVQRFHDVYEYLNVLAPERREKAIAGLDRDDPRLELVPESLKALNLIGRRKFVIICQAASNRILQVLSRIISLGAPIKVDIFPATYVHDLKDMLPGKNH